LPIFRFAYPKIWAKNMVYMIAETMWNAKIDGESIPLNRTQVYEEYSNEYYHFYAVKLTPALDNSSSYKVRVHSTLLRPYVIRPHVDESSYMRNGIFFNYSIVPLVDTPIIRCISSWNKPVESAIINSFIKPVNATIGSASVIFDESENIRAFNFSKEYSPNDVDYPYKGNIGCSMHFYPPVEVTSYERTVSIDSWYWVSVHEEITIKSFGARPNEVLFDIHNPVYTVTFALQRIYLWIDDAVDYRAYDDLGELTAPQGSQLLQDNRMTIYLRIPLMGEDSKKVSLDYKLKLEDVLEYEKTEFVLKTLGMPKLDMHVSNFKLNLIFPQGANFQYITFGNEPVDYTTGKTSVFLNIGRRQTVSMTVTNISTAHDITLKAGYYMSDLSYFIQPLTFALIVFLACLAYIGVRVLRKDVIQKVIITPETKEEIPIEDIQSFVEQYEEKTALQTRITALDESRRRKKVKAKEYDKQRKDSTKRKLKEKGRKFFDIIQKIEISEEKRTSVDRSIQDLRIRYIREKQISKDAYLRILKDYHNQIAKFERDIDKEIINLRLLIEHEAKEY